MASDATPATIPSALSISDIDTKVNHEPRIRDLRLAEVLGMVNPHSIRRLIQRHRGVLESLGAIISHQDAKLGAGRPSSSFYLTKRQALYLTAKADTPRAAMVTVEMVELFDRFTSGQPVGLPPRDGMALVRVGEEVVTIDLSATAQGGEGPWLVTPQGRMRPEIAPRVRSDGPGHGGGRVIIPDGIDERYATLWGRVVARGGVPVREHVVDGAGQPVTLSETEIMLALSLRQEMQRAIGVEIARLRGDVGAALTSALDRAVMAATERREGAV